MDGCPAGDGQSRSLEVSRIGGRAKNYSACCEDTSKVDTCYFHIKVGKNDELVTKSYFQSATYVSRKMQKILEKSTDLELDPVNCDCSNSANTVFRSAFTTSPNAGIPVIRDTYKNVMVASRTSVPRVVRRKNNPRYSNRNDNGELCVC